MATADEIAALRLLIAEPDETTYTDAALSLRLDDAAAPADSRVAWGIWTEKAAAYTALVSISEGGSSRSNGELLDKALKMVALFKGRLDTAEAAESPVRTAVVIRRLKR